VIGRELRQHDHIQRKPRRLAGLSFYSFAFLNGRAASAKTASCAWSRSPSKFESGPYCQCAGAVHHRVHHATDRSHAQRRAPIATHHRQLTRRECRRCEITSTPRHGAFGTKPLDWSRRSKTKPIPNRRFLPPWSVEETDPKLQQIQLFDPSPRLGPGMLGVTVSHPTGHGRAAPPSSPCGSRVAWRCWPRCAGPCRG
jgi:hypothetical protein